MTTSNPASTRSDFDPYSDEALLDPWRPGIARRWTGCVASAVREVRLDPLCRCSARAGDWKSFQCGYGVMMNDQMSQLVRGNTLCSDGAEHDALRGVIVRPLTSKALRPLREDIATDADAVVDRLVEQGSFDAVSELTQHLPGIVSKAIGLPEKRRDRMLVWPSRCSTASGR